MKILDKEKFGKAPVTIKNKVDLFNYIKNRTNHIIAIDGMSGTGKNYLIELILKDSGIEEDVAQKQDGKFALDTDVFLGTNTDKWKEVIDFSRRRREFSRLLIDNQTDVKAIETLEKNFRNEKHLSKIIENIIYALDNDLVEFTRKNLFIYNRGKGQIEKGRVNIELKNDTPYLLGGTNISKTVKNVSTKITTILLYSDPHISLLNALYRDFKKGKFTDSERFKFRLQETYILDKIQLKNIQNGYIDVLFKGKENFKEIVDFYKQEHMLCESEECISKFIRMLENVFTEVE